MEAANAKPSRLALFGSAVAVFAIAVLLRLPICYESLWLDELHTAWAIWADLGDVAPRAEVGNQTPLYFQIMWVWKQMVGQSEFALRFSSVLAVALASALLVIAVTLSTARLPAGILSGLVLAVEFNAIFFGTELRPYAWLMPLVVTAVWSSAELLSRRDVVTPANLRLVLVGSVCAAALLHPTSMVTLGLLAVIVALAGLVDWACGPDKRLRFHLSDIACLVILLATVLALVNSSLPESWSRRAFWRSFGRATEFRQLWTIWPWTTIVFLPLVLGMVTVWKQSPRAIATVLLPLLVAVMATLVFFVASYADFVPLWHRRYFIAVLPMLAWFAGGWVFFALPSPRSAVGRALAAVLIGIVVAALMWQQDTAQRLLSGKTRLVVRGEDWRGAIAWVNEHKQDGDQVWLDAGLIEARLFTQSPFSVDSALTPLQWEYFLFPASGPYWLPEAQFASPSARWRVPREQSSNTAGTAGERGRLWIISRSGHRTLVIWCQQYLPGWKPKAVIRRYGRIYVARLDQSVAEELANGSGEKPGN